MKRIVITSALVFFCLQFSFAQQIISTNQKSTCTYHQGTSELQNCVDENINAVFTFKENTFVVIHSVNGTDVHYTINSKTYERPFWKYQISDGQGTMYVLQANQTTKEFSFYPTNLEHGAIIYKYHFN